MVLLHRQRKPNRLRRYDYSQNGWYFITICTKNKEEYFGSVIQGEMKLNKYGIIAQKYWKSIPDHYEYVLIDDFIIMPNHAHGIIIVCNNRTKHSVGTGHCPVPTNKLYYGLLSKIINAYKNIVTKSIRYQLSKNQFQWQRSFYDHIIRSEQSLQKIRQYIKLNPSKWDEDENNNGAMVKKQMIETLKVI